MECSICKKSITGRFYKDYWDNRICAEHFEKGEVVFCSSCGALLPKEPRFMLGEGRYVCNTCQAQIISRKEDIEKIKKSVIYRLINEGVRFQDKNLDSVPIEIVDMQTLARLLKMPPSLAQKGLTQTSTSMNLAGVIMGKSPRMSHKIYILDNLIKIEFAGTLAHEMMHVWQNENGIKMAAPQCEGLCNLGSWLIYNTLKTSKNSYFIKSMKENPDPIYGDGFRYVLSKYEKLGWEGVLELAKSGQL